MNKELLEILGKVVVLLENGVKPQSLQHVLSQMGCEYNNGVLFEFHYIIQRLENYFKEDFKQSNFLCEWNDIHKMKEK